MSDDDWNGDPARGCGLMLLLAIGLWVALFVIAYLVVKR